ncbi:hypothetical protein DYI37_06245 [Fulvimarina endophytica]|uniref:Outer membrane lipoprotein n=1 Tax=Fulvimarina endophytica TaxID=2293836 RepID=A0A371X867_9HYPH|nr:hypothetical protein [Fulvimarina endophytica]RFC65416.1 hypothetical protein DYI37_06245 [Fulvimarina endophytica]
MRRIVLSLTVASTAAFSACQMQERAELAPAVPQGVEGTWNSVGGPVNYTASLNSGQFRSTERGTGAVLAQGTYSNIGPGQVTIVYRPTTRDTEVAANCNQTAPDTLSCATSTGNRFQLQRA